MPNSIKFTGKIKLLSPMAHNSDENVGTDTKFRRIGIVFENKVIRIPDYSGNAFRGILRRIAAKQFCDLLGIKKEEISLAMYYTFFVGGSLKKGSAQNFIEVGQKREMRKMVPFLSLWGTALQNQIIAGKMDIGIAWPICRETAHLTGIESAMTIWEITDEIFYTRRDDLEDAKFVGAEKKEEKSADLFEEEPDKKKKPEKKEAQQMKYTIECLVPGVELYHTICLNMVDEIEESCFGYAIREFTKDGKLGGKSGTGHGQCAYDYSPAWPEPTAYIDYVRQNKDEIIKYVEKIGGKL